MTEETGVIIHSGKNYAQFYKNKKYIPRLFPVNLDAVRYKCVKLCIGHYLLHFLKL